MIRGQVAPERQAVVRVRLSGRTGIEIERDAVIDTGFTEYLTLPPDEIVALNLPYLTDTDMELADGSVLTMRVFEALLDWGGHQHRVPTHEAAGGPLIGMSLLYGHRLTIDVVDGGPVTVIALR